MLSIDTHRLMWTFVIRGEAHGLIDPPLHCADGVSAGAVTIVERLTLIQSVRQYGTIRISGCIKEAPPELAGRRSNDIIVVGGIAFHDIGIDEAGYFVRDTGMHDVPVIDVSRDFGRDDIAVFVLTAIAGR